MKSTQGRRSLKFSNREGDYFTVELAGDGISATKRIWGYTDTGFLVDLFESIARDWKGWDGERHWSAIESDLEIDATSDRLGHIKLQIKIRSNDPENDWRAIAPIFLDSGTLDNIAGDIKRFFCEA